jgi:hypothetical protein
LSSILDALNKLEKEASRRDYPLKRARAARKEFTSKIAAGIIGIVCICIMAVGFAVYYRRGPEKMPLPPPEAPVPASLPKTPASLPSILPNPETTATAAAGLPGASTLEKKTETEPKLLDNGKRKEKVESEQRQVLKAAEDSTETALVDTAPRDSEPRAAGSKKNSFDSTAEVSTKALAQEEKPLPINRLKGVSFRIQAISWGETPQERLVVISDEVLREGDGIEGYRISRINPDDILLRRGNNTYRLDFGLKERP